MKMSCIDSAIDDVFQRTDRFGRVT